MHRRPGLPHCRIQADAIVVSSQQHFAPAQIVISHGRIVEITPTTKDTPDLQLDNCVLLPGLVNPHTHLEFSCLSEPLPAGSTFPDWIRAVFLQRQQANTTPLSRETALATGLAESAAAGVVALGDIVTMPWQPNDLAASRLTWPTSKIDLSQTQAELLQAHLDRSHRPQIVAFIEQLGLTAERQRPLMEWRDELLRSTSSGGEPLVAFGLSPHAPYSTPELLWQSLAKLAAAQDLPLAMHVLESPAERQWLDEGTGPMHEFLSQLGVGDFRQPPDFVARLCEAVATLRSTLLIHGNYLTASELDCIAGSTNISLTYCPRTHLHFHHAPYPMSAIIERGIRLLIGTDSRSTNPDLNLWQEARTALGLHGCLRPRQAFSAITDASALALGLSHQLGTLEVGKHAALNLLQLQSPPPPDLDSLFERLFDSPHPTLL